MPIKLQNRRRQLADIARRNDDSFDAVVDHVARFARRDLRQPAGRRFVSDFRASFALRRENVDGSLAQIIFHVAHEADHLDVVPPEFLQMRLRFLMHGADQPELRVLQVEPMPRFEQMMDAFALDQRAGKNRAKNRRPRPGLNRSTSTPRGR